MHLAWIAKTQNRSPSQILKITDELTAFEFDAVVTFAERNFETARRKAEADYLAAKIQLKISELLSGKKSRDNADYSNADDDTDETEARRIVIDEETGLEVW